MESKQFCQIKSSEEAKKEMEEMTRREIEKLTQMLKDKPELIKYNEESSESESDSDSYNSSDTESKLVACSYKLAKKESELNKLEERKHFATLEINNLMLENSDLKKELENMKKIIDKNNNMIHTICKIHDIKTLDDFNNYNINEMAQSIPFLTEIIINLQKKYLDINDQIANLKTELDNNFPDEKYNSIKRFYLSNILEFENNIKQKYNDKRNDYEKFLVSYKNYHLSGAIIFAVFMIFVSAIISKFY